MMRRGAGALAMVLAVFGLGTVPGGAVPSSLTDVQCVADAASRLTSCVEEAWSRRTEPGSRPLVVTDASGATVIVAHQRDRDVVVESLDAATGAVRWSSRFDSGAYDVARDVVVAGDRILVAGGALGTFSVIAFNGVDGSIAWSRSEGAGAAMGATMHPSGTSIYVVGERGGAAAVEHYDVADGSPLHSHTASGTETYSGGITVASGGSVVVAGQIGADGLLAGFAQDLQPRWATSVSAGRSLDLDAVASADEGRVTYALGTTGYGPGKAIQATVVAVDTSTGGDGEGTVQWIHEHRLSGIPTIGSGIVADHRGVYVAGYRALTWFDDAFVFALAPDGSLRWERFEAPVTDSASAVFGPNPITSFDAVDLVGDLLVATGEINSGYSCIPFGCMSTNGYDAWTVAFDADDGSYRWIAREGTEPVDGFDDWEAGRSVAVVPDGDRVLVVGESGAAGSERDIVTWAYDSGVVAVPGS